VRLSRECNGFRRSGIRCQTKSINDATTSKTALFKDYQGSTLAGSSYTISKTSGAITDAYTAAGGGNQGMGSGTTKLS
jgi:hypothetical protein